MQSRLAQRCMTECPEDTRRVGRYLGQQACAGDVITCRGSLGAGKTTLVQGFAAGVGVSSAAYVRSPTFALVHIYDGRIPLYHFDFYRLTSESEVEDIGFEDYLAAGGVVIIEWAEKFPGLLPADTLAIHINLPSPHQRCIQWTASTMAYSRYFLWKY